MRKLILIWVLAITMVGNVMAQSADEALATVKKSVDIVLADLKQNKDKYQSNVVALNDMIDEKMLPYFDVDVMAKYVLGKNWKTASPAQRTRFINAFKQLVMRTYSVGLLDYSDAKVSYGTPTPVKKSRTKIKATIVNTSGKKFPIELSMRYKNGKWKGYDVSMDGLSVITSYRSSVGQEVAEKGMDKVITEIETLNAKGATE